MFGNPAAERAAIEMTYTDTATLSRPITVTVDNITRHEPQAIYANVSCALSYGGSDNSSQTSAQNTIDYDATVFLAPELIIHAGDKVVIARHSRSYTLSVVGSPRVYATHQEVRVKEDDIA